MLIYLGVTPIEHNGADFSEDKHKVVLQLLGMSSLMTNNSPDPLHRLALCFKGKWMVNINQ